MTRPCGRRDVSWRLAGCLGLALLLPGCAGLERVLGFEAQLERAEQTASIRGRIESEGRSEGTIVVVLASVRAGAEEELVGEDSFVRTRPGSYAFALRSS